MKIIQKINDNLTITFTDSCMIRVWSPNKQYEKLCKKYNKLLDKLIRKVTENEKI